ncbi:MAG: hypothetical protein U9R53_00830 [Chloroflexota bacterium]|nr:hypothetical protein [Chloroflexota bacterium]
MTGSVSEEIPSDEKTIAGWAYFLGLIPALIIWGIKRGESSYVSFHALQAALYDGFMGLVAALFLGTQFIGMVFWMIIAFVGTNIIADTIEPETPIIYLIITLFIVLSSMGWVSLMSLVLLGLSLVDLVAAYNAFKGKDWRYPVFATWAGKLNLAVQT